MLGNMFKNDEPKWQFIKNNYGEMNSIESTEMESFQKVPIDSLARELTQNSLDAREGEHPAKIEFKTFKMRVSDIPGVNDLKKEIKACIKFHERNTFYNRLFTKMLNELDKEQIECLRVSDYYTIGLKGVASNETMNPFNYLVKGNGFTSKKGTNSGGSKGMGKFSTFLSSSIHTVFYSTLNKNNEKGYMGVIKLGSRELEDGLQMTTGKGFYSIGNTVSPILEDFTLDKDFTREEGNYGTDVYILGFKKPENWKKQIISKILDSFLVAIHNGDLEIQIEDDVIINKNTLQSVVFNTQFNKSDKKKIESQYELLNEQTVYQKTIDIKGKGEVQFYLKDYNRNEKDRATNKCIMIRHPYMKIKEYNIPFPVSASAMCIINENELNNMLKEIENAEHTDWEPNRIEQITGDRDMVKELKGIIRCIKEELKKFVMENLLSNKNENIDLEYAGDYLPDLTLGGDSVAEQQDIIKNKPSIGNLVRKEIINKYGNNPDLNRNSLMPDIGEITPDGNEASIPKGKNDGNSNGTHGGKEKGGIDQDGDDIVMRKVFLSTIRPKVVLLNKNEGKYLITYKGNENIDNCGVEFFYLDDNNNKYSPKIKEAKINGKTLTVSENEIVDLSIRENEIYKIEISTDLDDIYACEVKIYANVIK